MTSDQLDTLAEKIANLSPADRLRLAAELLDQQKAYGIVHTIVSDIAFDLGHAVAEARASDTSSTPDGGTNV